MKLEFPPHYYTKHTAITKQQLQEVISEQYFYLLSKIDKAFRYKLQKQYQIEYLQDLLTDVIDKIADKFFTGKVSFESQTKLIGYILISCWNNNRTNHVSSKLKPFEEEEWITEMRTKQPTTYKLKPQLIHFTYQSYLVPAAETTTGTEQDERDEYFGNLKNILTTYLNDSVEDGEFTTEEVEIFNLYMSTFNNIKELVYKTGKQEWIVKDALRKIKKHLKHVDWYINTTGE